MDRAAHQGSGRDNRMTDRDALARLTRYDLVQVNACYTTDHQMEPSDDGEWVRYDDIGPTLARLTAALDAYFASKGPAEVPWMQAFNQLMAALHEAKRVLAQTDGP
jgi:hypothetical protein